jgi:hypothetical protein
METGKRPYGLLTRGRGSLTHYCTAAIGFVSKNLFQTVVGTSPAQANRHYENFGSDASNA